MITVMPYNAISMLALAADDASKALEHSTMRRPAETLWEERAEQALFFVVDLGIILVAIAFIICLWRVVRGPTLVDRALASDTISMQVVGFAVLLTVRAQTLLYFDAVLIVAILGFVSTVAAAQFIGRRGRV